SASCVVALIMSQWLKITGRIHSQLLSLASGSQNHGLGPYSTVDQACRVKSLSCLQHPQVSVECVFGEWGAG
ncbi:hypothetical protein AVEN_227302-1, partial [Araneus ventricosus]